MARLALIFALALACGPAFAGSATGLVASIAGFVVGGPVGFAIALAGNLLAAADLRRKARAQQAEARAQYNASLQDRNVTVLNNEAGWRIVYGNPSPVGGAVVAIHTSGDKDQYKHLVVVFAAHECQAIDEVYIEGVPVGTLDGSGWCTLGSDFYESSADSSVTEIVTLDGSGNGTVSHTIGSLLFVSLGDAGAVAASASGTSVSAPSAAGQQVYVVYTYPNGSARVNVQKHLSPGGVDTADAFLISLIPSKWTTAHKLSGHTYIVLTLDLNFARFQGGPPNVTAKLRGKKLYDWRTATTVYSNNPALCVADYLMGAYGFGAGLSQIDSAAAIAAANACDSQGYTCDGVISTEQARDASLTMLEDSMAGNTHFSGGVWRIMAGAWTTPVMTLDDLTTLAGPIEVLQASNPAEGRFNTVRAQYVPSSGLGVSADMTPYSVAAYLTADGATRVQDISLPMTPTMGQAQKLASIALERSRLGLTIRYPAHLSAWKLQPGDRVYCNNTEFGFVSKTMRMVDWDFDPKAPVGLVLTEDIASAWTGTFSGVDLQLGTSNLADPWAKPAAPSNLVATSGTGVLQKFRDGTIVTRVLVTWIASTVRAVLQGGYTQLQWRNATATDDRWQSQDLASDVASYYLTGPIDATTILVRVRHITGVGAQGAWSTLSHYVLGKTEAPTAPGFVSATQSLVFWGAVADVDLAGYRIRAYPGSTGAVFSRATPLHNDLLTTGPYTLATKLYGVQTIMVVSEDTTGNQSAAVSTVVDFGAPDISNAVQTKDYSALGYPGTLTTCAVSGTSLLASAGSNLYALADLYGEADVYATTYNAMTWVSEAFAPAYQGGTLTLAQSTAGASVTIEYQVDGSVTNDAYALADVYASTDLYGASGSFAVWPGALAVNRMQGVIFRVSILGGATQGQITAFAPSLVMPDARQTFGGPATSSSGGVAINSAGTRMAPSSGTPTRNWIALKSVQITPVVDGSGAIGGRILDFNTVSGPLLQLVDSTGTAVTGRASIDIVGLADG